MKKSRHISDLPPMDDDQLARFWDSHEPEDFHGWQEGDLRFARPPKKLIQVRLDARDVRVIDRESQISGIDRAQLVRSWVKEKIRSLARRDRRIES